MDNRTEAERRYDATRLSPAPIEQPSTNLETIKAWIASHFNGRSAYVDILIGTIDGCQVLADYDEDGDLFQATMTWRDLELSTDGYSYVNLVKREGSKAGCEGDIDFEQWQVLSQAVKAGMVDALIELAQSNDELKFVSQHAI